MIARVPGAAWIAWVPGAACPPPQCRAAADALPLAPVRELRLAQDNLPNPSTRKRKP
jgi:hypothetical protein